MGRKVERWMAVAGQSPPDVGDKCASKDRSWNWVCTASMLMLDVVKDLAPALEMTMLLV